MSLLLDALKSTEPEPGAADGNGVEPEAWGPEEEPLDGPATLALLAQKATAQTVLSLMPTSGIATAPPDSAAELISTAAVEPGPVAAAPVGLGLVVPGTVADMARTQPIAKRASSAAAGRSATAAPILGTAATANKHATVTAPSTTPRAKKYALVLAALAALGCIAFLGKSLWWPGTTAVLYPAAGEAQPTPPTMVEPTTPTTAAVQVSSTRPADQFAYTGNAPEIDLRNTDSPLNATAAVKAMPPDAAAVPQDSTPPPSATTRARSAPTHPVVATLSITRSEGRSSIDRHIQAGYLALASGNVANAQTEYFAALELDPYNVDAWMGAATVAARDGRSKAAAAAYAKVLKLEPGNPDATAAMATLGAGGLTGENNESRLKVLIAGDDGGRPALHAALAGVYAADSRWAEATQEYFTALAKDPGNPDLAFNVAASLDQNRNPAMALTYYGQALAFARQRPTQIDLHAIEQRIGQLQAHAGHAPGSPETP